MTETRCSISLTEIKEIKQTNDYETVNQLIRENWILIDIATNSKNEAIYLLGRVSI